MKAFSAAFAVACLLACESSRENIRMSAANTLRENGWVADIASDSMLQSLLPALNCIAAKAGDFRFVLSDGIRAEYKGLIALVPFRNATGIAPSVALSDLERRMVFIDIRGIREFVDSNSLGDSEEPSGFIGLVLLHELGHFAYGVPGYFDRNRVGRGSRLGELDFGTTPETLNRDKRFELKIDSAAMELVAAGFKSKDGECFQLCSRIQRTIIVSQFMLSGTRAIRGFGDPNVNLLRDRNWTHPNLELRLAFMNYYLGPSDALKELIDGYLYEREVRPVIRQSSDPRIFQGLEKVLPEDRR